MSHYTSGLRVLDISNISSPTETAFFDVYPANNNTSLMELGVIIPIIQVA